MDTSHLRLRRGGTIGLCCAAGVGAAALLFAPAAYGAPAPDRPPTGVNPQPDPVGQPAASEPAQQPVVTRSSFGSSGGTAIVTRTVVEPAAPAPAAERPARPRARTRQAKPAPKKTAPVRAQERQAFLETAWTRALRSPQTFAASLPATAESRAAALRAALAMLALVVASGSLLVTARARAEGRG